MARKFKLTTPPDIKRGPYASNPPLTYIGACLRKADANWLKRMGRESGLGVSEVVRQMVQHIRNGE